MLLNIPVSLRHLAASVGLSKFRNFFFSRLLSPTLFFLPFFTRGRVMHIVCLFLCFYLTSLLLTWRPRPVQLASNLKVHCCRLQYWSVKQISGGKKTGDNCARGGWGAGPPAVLEYRPFCDSPDHTDGQSAPAPKATNNLI